MTIFSAASARLSAAMIGRFDFARISLPSSHVGALQPHHQRHRQLHLARRRHHALGDHVAAHDAAEDVDQDAFDVRVRQDDLERRGHPLLGGAAAHIEEVRRRRAIQLDDVHRRHRQSGAVHQAADVAVQRHVIQVVLGGFEFLRILLALVAQLLQFGMAEQRVVVEAELGIQRDRRRRRR